MLFRSRLVGEEKEALLALAGSPAAEPAAEGASPPANPASPAQLAAWSKAVDRLYEESGKLGLKERMQVWLKEDPARLGQEVNGRKERIGEVEVYRQMLDRYNAEWATARTDYQFEHQDKRWSKLMEKKAEVLGPIDGAVKDFELKAYTLLDVKQNQKGPLPPPMTQLRQVDLTTMWLLTILGVLLIVGLFSRLAALAGAALMVLFYLPMPPWPGVPEAPGPEHSLFVNKNLIEALALLAIASLRTASRACCSRSTASGKFKRGKSHARHILTSKSTKRKRNLDLDTLVSEGDQKRVEKMLPYGRS